MPRRTAPTSAPRSADGRGPGSVPAVVRGADPRLTHAGGAAPGLIALQRTAGNAAVAALVGGPTIQRAVQVDAMSTRVSVGDTAAAPAGATGASAAMTQANGVLRADTIIADNVVASSYTPGAGNVW